MEGFGAEVIVMRNDHPDLLFIKGFDKVVLSPGPGLPSDAGQLLSFIDAYHAQVPILGVCLGMQALALYFGDELYNQNQVKHGVSAEVTQKKSSILWNGVPNVFRVGLYHSWAVRLKRRSNFKATLVSENNVLMAMEHKKLPLFGVQFHPESILTENGRKIVENFLNS